MKIGRDNNRARAADAFLSCGRFFSPSCRYATGNPCGHGKPRWQENSFSSDRDSVGRFSVGCIPPGCIFAGRFSPDLVSPDLVSLDLISRNLFSNASGVWPFHVSIPDASEKILSGGFLSEFSRSDFLF